MTGTVNPTVGFGYVMPTQNADGSALTLAEIRKFQIGLRQAPGEYTLIKDDATLEADKQLTPLSLIGQIPYGQWYAAVRTVTRDDRISDWSAEVAFVLEAPPPAKPNPPSGFSIG